MQSKKLMVRFATLAVAAAFGAQFALATEALAAKGPGGGGHGGRTNIAKPQTSGKRANCTSVPVAGRPGTFIHVCSTARP